MIHDASTWIHKFLGLQLVSKLCKFGVQLQKAVSVETAQIHRSGLSRRLSSRVAMHSPTGQPASILAASASCELACRRSISTVFKTAHRISPSAFFCENCNAEAHQSYSHWKHCQSVIKNAAVRTVAIRPRSGSLVKTQFSSQCKLHVPRKLLVAGIGCERGSGAR